MRNYMQKIHQITQAIPEILLLYFGEPWTCPGMPDQTQQILQSLIKSFMDIMQKMNIVPQKVFEILKFKRSCDLICGEHWAITWEVDFS